MRLRSRERTCSPAHSLDISGPTRSMPVDFVAKRVLPYSKQQLSGTLGGPIVKDRVHFFGSYEYEHEPKTYTYNSPYPAFNVDVHFPTRIHKFLGRLDYEFSLATRLHVRASRFNNLFYAAGN